MIHCLTRGSKSLYWAPTQFRETGNVSMSSEGGGEVGREGG